MKKILYINKKVGETPLQSILNFKKKHPSYKDLPMTYAGRLDPMAEGKMILLAGDECKNKEKYNNFQKVYEVEVLLGFETDTADILGLAKLASKKDIDISDMSNKNENKYEKIPPKKLHEIFKKYIGKFYQPYPLYSSKRIKEALGQVRKKTGMKVPGHQVEIYQIKYLSQKTITAQKLLEYIKKRVSKVVGDFRQEKIMLRWVKILSAFDSKDAPATSFKIINIKVSCASGAYMRVLASDIGHELGTKAIALKIKRTEIGFQK